MAFALMKNHFEHKGLHDLNLKSIEKVTLTPDLGGSATTSEVGDAVVQQIYISGVEL